MIISKKTKSLFELTCFTAKNAARQISIKLKLNQR
ncbi:hypothetical protein BN439_1223 [Erwinia amylovora Ea644]|nr:hypothetical protein BN439_1223 [Erwinia amylovora Ea644]